MTERARATLHRLETDRNVWIATADHFTARPHLIPLSLAWNGVQVILATPSDSVTVRNLNGSAFAKLALDSADDVVLIDAKAEVVSIAAIRSETLDGYVQRVGWDPRQETAEMSMIFLTPWVVRAWNGESEIEGRTIMRSGVWSSG